MRVLIADDLPLARAQIRRQLEADPEIEIVAECGDGRSAVQAVRTHNPDLLLLDVELREGGGFEVLEEIGAGAVPAVVFVTAHETFAARAFDVEAVDYLVKPFSDERLRAAVSRVKRRMATVPRALRESGRALVRSYPRRLVLRVDDRAVVLSIADVDYVEAAGNYLYVHAGREAHLTRERLASIEDRLPPQLFARIHRSTIVNVTRITEIHPLFNGDQSITLKTGQRLTVSRTYRERFLRTVEGGTGSE
jgi:two-component system LytT family response regulator